MSDFLLGTAHLFGDPVRILIFIAGAVGGLVFGAIPGLSLLTLAALVLPLTAYMQPTDAIMFYGVIYCTGVYGGAVTAILFNIPGSVENAPTAFDGYPMTQKGQAGKAIGYAITCSAIGGTVSAVVMMAAVGFLADWAVTTFGPLQVFGLIFVALAVTASVGTRSIWKGWLSVLLGLLIGTIGTDPYAGVPRFTFGNLYLTAGIGFVPLILGAFAVAEVFVQAERIVTGAFRAPKVAVQYPALVEFWAARWTVLRSTVVGFFCGLLPGIGATLAAFLSYNEAVRWSRHPERFGKGEPMGVVASETANNAATGGAIIPLLALGLPGGALTAIMYGVFNIHGMEPGPLVLINARDLAWVLFASMFWASLSILLLSMVETKSLVNLLRIPFGILGPTILVLATIGAYALRNSILDVWVMFLSGIAAYFLRRTGYSIPAIIMAVILGELGESAFTKAMVIVDYNLLGFFREPLTAFLLLAGIATVVYNVVRRPKVAMAG